MRSLTHASSIYVGASALNAIVPFALLGYLARVLGAAEFGRIGSFLVFVNLASVLVGLNSHGLISVGFFREPGGRGVSTAVSACLVVMALTLVAVLGVVTLFGNTLASLTQLPRIALTIGVLCAAAQFVVQICLTYLQSSGQAVRFGAIAIAVSAGTALATLVILTIDSSWLARAWGQLIATSLIAGAAVWAIVRALRLPILSMRDPVLRAIRFGLPLVPHSIAVALMAGYDRIYVAQNISDHASGQYFGAAQVATILNLGAMAVNQAWVPWLYARLAASTDATRAEVVRVSWRLAGLALVLAIAMALAAQPLANVVLGPGYEQSGMLLQLLAPSAAIGSLYFLLANHLFFAERTHALPLVTCTAALFQVVLIHELGSRFGTFGVASAVLASQFVFVVGVWWLVQRACPMPWFRTLK